MTKFTIDEIRKYIESQDSLGDVLYNLNVKNIEKANIPTFECERCGENLNHLGDKLFWCSTCDVEVEITW